MYRLMVCTSELDKILPIKFLTKKYHHQSHSLTNISNNYGNKKERLYQLTEILELYKTAMQQYLQKNTNKHTSERKGKDGYLLSTLSNSFALYQSPLNYWRIPRDTLKLKLSVIHKVYTHNNEMKFYYKFCSASGKGIQYPAHIRTLLHKICSSYFNGHTFSQSSKFKPDICKTSHRFNFPFKPMIIYSNKLLTSNYLKRIGNNCEGLIEISVDNTLPYTVDRGRTKLTTTCSKVTKPHYRHISY